ncbi:MAG: hypothetical protein ACYTBP_11095 [Planctomycetota bacterium]
MNTAVKLIAVLLVVGFLFLSGCTALTMSPDCWLDPLRWEQQQLVTYEQYATAPYSSL